MTLQLDPIDLLQGLVRVPSVNAMGRSLDPAICGEHRLTTHLEQLVRDSPLVERLVVSRQFVHDATQSTPARENLLVLLPGEQSTLLWEVHQDTVPVDSMTIPPFGAEIQHGRVHGRGACDVKGGMAAMIAALLRLAAESREGRPAILLACTVNEEFGFTGVRRLVESWQPERFPLALKQQPDAAIVAEPTSLQTVVAHKGVLRWKIHTHGKAVHTSRPDDGENAIFRMARVLPVMERLADELHQRASTSDDPSTVGTPTMSVGTIEGGVSDNTVPDRCTIAIDRRIVPGEDPGEVYRKLVATVDAQLHHPPWLSHDPPYLQTAGLAGENRGLAEYVTHQTREAGHRAECIGVDYCTDAPAVAAAGVPTVVFGPGSIAQAHTNDEWIDIEEVQAAAEILYRIGRDWTAPCREQPLRR